MPHRILGHYLYAVLASGSVALSFVGAVVESISPPTHRVMLAVGDAPVEAISPVMMSWLAFIGSAFIVMGKAYVDFRAKKRDADLADAAGWGVLVKEARADLGDAIAKTRDLEAQLKSRAAEVDRLKAQNSAQASQIDSLEAKVGQLANSQNSVITAVNKQQVKVKDVNKRVGELEQAVGSSSNLEIPIPPPAEDSTTIDLPTMG